jgi:hypothetical protein
LSERIALIGFDDIVLADLMKSRYHSDGTRSHSARHACRRAPLRSAGRRHPPCRPSSWPPR